MTNNSQERLETEISELLDNLDGCEIYGVIMWYCDIQQMESEEFLDSPEYWDLLNNTQSNPVAADRALTQVFRLDAILADMD